MSMLECRGLCVYYDRVEAVHNLSFAVNEGDYICIVGENGAGKSTLVKALLGLVRPSAGEILYKGVKPGEIGYLPQQMPMQKDFPACVGEVVLSGCQNSLGFPPFYKSSHRQRAKAALDALGMKGMEKRSYRELSGGQQQRALLARALCATKKLLILDEPSASLDPLVAAEMYALLDMLNKKQGIAVIMVSHDIHGAVRHAGKILHMQAGGALFADKESYTASLAYGKITGKEEGGQHG